MRKVHEQIAKVLVDVGAVGFTPQAPITFKSGIKSPVYVDNRTIPYYPSAWQQVITAFQQIMAGMDIQFDVVAGIATAGIPHSAALGYTMSKPSIFIRKEAKEHGQKRRIEGGEVTGKRVLLVEDLITTGGSSISGVLALREEGAIVEDLLAIVSYGFQDTVDRFTDTDVHLHTLTTFPFILDYAHSQGKIEQSVLKSVEDWLNDPHGWAERNGIS